MRYLSLSSPFFRISILKSKLFILIYFNLFVVVVIYASYLHLKLVTLSSSHATAVADQIKSKHQQQQQQLRYQNEADDYEYNIFFVETNISRSLFNIRQLCAVESAAKNNPNGMVYVYTLNAVPHNQTEFLRRYKNVRIVKFTFDSLLKNSLLEEWWTHNKQRVLNHEFSVGHLSDLLRIFLLYKYGGYYSDLDTVTLRSVQPLLRYDGVGKLHENVMSLGNGVLVFRKNHSFLHRCLEEYMTYYSDRLWGINGPQLVMRVIIVYCHVVHLNDSSLRFNPIRVHMDQLNLPRSTNKSSLFYYEDQKCAMTIFPENYFYSFTYYETDIDSLFNPNYAQLAVSKFFDAYSVHFYNKLTEYEEKHELKYNLNSTYEILAQFNCPMTYEKMKYDYFKNYL